MDHKLNIFKEVALTRSFSQASKRLNISQPAVSKTIKNLEEKYGRAFFDRTANTIELTPDGEVFLIYTEKIIHLYEQLEDEFWEDKMLEKRFKIGASTTAANFILPPLIAFLQKIYPQIKIDLLVGNTLDVQQAVLKKEIHLGIVEGDNHHTRLHYEQFVKDELVLVAKYDQEEMKEISQEEFTQLPLVGREIGSGTREVIENHLEKNKIRLQEYCSVFGSTESIKSYLLNSSVYAFLSMHSIQQELKEQRLRIIDIENLTINRWFYFITRQGFQSKSSDKLQHLLSTAYNQSE